MQSQFRAQQQNTWPKPAILFDYLVIAGGGGGGNSSNGSNHNGGGAGGAGGYRESSGTTTGCYTVSPRNCSVAALTTFGGTFNVVVGAGGTGVYPAGPAGNGSNSSFESITATGGGRGRCDADGQTSSGGSAGGAGAIQRGLHPGASNPGNAGGFSPVEGFASGVAAPNHGGGGGGAGGNACGEDGGAGVTSNITNTPTARGGGGGAGGTSGNIGTATAGGGAGGSVPNGAGSAGTVNTGGGGGGGSGPAAPFNVNGGNGGSGLVVLRFPSGACVSVSPGTNTVTTLPAPAGGYKVATFTVSGTNTVTIS
jgi:hypothetical protein